MLFRILSLALGSAAIACGAARAHSTADADNLSQQLHDKLVEQGYSDVHVVPQSFLISAKDKNGKPIMMLLGPNSMTVLSAPPSGDPNTAQSHDGKDELIQQ